MKGYSGEFSVVFIANVQDEVRLKQSVTSRCEEARGRGRRNLEAAVVNVELLEVKNSNSSAIHFLTLDSDAKEDQRHENELTCDLGAGGINDDRETGKRIVSPVSKFGHKMGETIVAMAPRYKDTHNEEIAAKGMMLRVSEVHVHGTASRTEAFAESRNPR